MKRLFPFLLLLLTLCGCEDNYADLPDGLYTEIETNKGKIIASLDYEKAPVTVANFITLAEGTNPFVADAYKGKLFFDGLSFHRVIADFMIQTGDPDGNGAGGPGYKFTDEITDLKHDKPGILSMANAGPGTNGSQFFITHVATPHLDGKHTVFGQVIGDGMQVVNSVVMGDQMKAVRIIRKGEAAKKFDALKVFKNYVATDEENQKKIAAEEEASRKLFEQQHLALKVEKAAYLADVKLKGQKTPTGLRYRIISKGNGGKPAPGSIINIQYSGYLESGELFDSSVDSIAQKFGKYDPRRAAAGMYSPIQFQAGRKDGMIPGFIEGLEKMSIGDKAVIYIPTHLGYGPQGAGKVIPPNANLFFELELLPENK
ncbi:MAG: peptidylprolyl isomerase [Flavobacterium sp.]|nr:peptidylprolyl isomerase [Flavobacterium sp.]